MDKLERFGERWVKLFFITTLILVSLIIIGAILRVTENMGYHHLLTDYNEILFLTLGGGIMLSFCLGTFLLLGGHILAGVLEPKKKSSDSLTVDQCFKLGLLMFFSLFIFLLVIMILLPHWLEPGMVFILSLFFSISISGIVPKIILNYYSTTKNKSLE